MEIRRAVLTGWLELDDGTQAQVPEVTAESPASRGLIALRFAVTPVPPGRTVAGARVRNEDNGTVMRRRFCPYLTIGPGDWLTVSFGLDDCV